MDYFLEWLRVAKCQVTFLPRYLYIPPFVSRADLDGFQPPRTIVGRTPVK
jgi:hypothetical protein